MAQNFEISPDPYAFGIWNYRELPLIYSRYRQYCYLTYPHDCQAFAAYATYFTRMHYASDAVPVLDDDRRRDWPPSAANSLFSEWDLPYLQQTGKVTSKTEPQILQYRVWHLTIWDYWLTLQPENDTWEDAENTDFMVGDADALPLPEVANRMSAYLAWLQHQDQPFPNYDNFLYWYCQSSVFMMLTGWQYQLRDHTPATFAKFLSRQQATFIDHVRTYLSVVNTDVKIWK